MPANVATMVALRKKRSWSQDELATAAGLNRRTIQRIENDGTASLPTLKAVASALEADLDDLKFTPEKSVNKFEYKTVVLPSSSRGSSDSMVLHAAGWQP